MTRKKICLTGIKPTGMPHLGNYIGAIRPAIQLAQSGDFEAFYFIADYHSLTTLHDAKLYKEYVYTVAACWLALGLDPTKVALYKQSDIPEILEISWILSCFTSKGLMNRAHAYKAITQNNQEKKRDSDYGVNMGVYSYPVLMAADILFIQTEVVPVGADQLQHIEMCRHIAQAFNSNYGDIFTLPQAAKQDHSLLVPGSDGRKMSKSYNNHIPLFTTEKKLKKLIFGIKTDSSPPESPKDPDDSLVFDLYKTFAMEDDIEIFRKQFIKGISWGAAKAELFNKINGVLSSPREKYNLLMEDRKRIDDILAEGATRTRSLAQKFLTRVKKSIGAL